MKKLTVMASLIVMLLALTSGVYASVAFYEGFGYTAGTNVLDNGYFNGPYYSNGDLYSIQSGSIVYNGLATTGNQAHIAIGPTAAAAIRVLPTAVTNLFTTPGTFYLSYVMYGGGQSINFGILDDAVNPTGFTNYVLEQVQFQLPGWGTGWEYRFIAGAGDSGYAIYPNDANQIGPHLIVWKIQINATPALDKVQVVLDPALNSGEPAWDTAGVSLWTYTGDVSKSVNGMIIDGNHNPGDTCDTNIDEIRIATTWGEVAPYQPPLVPPAAPTGLTATATAVGIPAINLAWTDNATTEDAYSVERAPSATGPWTILTPTGLPVNTQTYHDPNLVGETTYYYRVQAYNGAGGSAYATANATTSAAAVPDMLTYQGKLTNAAGVPVADSTYTLVFKLYDAETAGTLLWTSAGTPATTSGGLFTAKIRNVPPGVFPGNKHVWMEIVVNGETLTPRLEVGSDPYALRAGYVQL